MTVEEAIDRRRTIKRFAKDEISVADVREMLSLACRAPNVGNRQPWRFIVVTQENLIKQLFRLVERQIDEMATWPEMKNEALRLRAFKEGLIYLAHAPMWIIVVNTGYTPPFEEQLVKHGSVRFRDAHRLFGHPDFQSIGCLVGYLSLLAEERGYGTWWAVDPLIAKHEVATALELKSGEEIAVVIALGKPDEYPPVKPRKQIDTITEWR